MRPATRLELIVEIARLREERNLLLRAAEDFLAQYPWQDGNEIVPLRRAIADVRQDRLPVERP